MQGETIPWKSRVSRNIKAFVDSPITNLVKGMILFFIGISEASRTLVDDIEQAHLRVGHGLVIIGFFNILGALPHLLDGIEAHEKYQEARERKKAQAGQDSESP